MGVAATARCRNAGIVLMPIMATPPLFRKMRRETFIVVLLHFNSLDALMQEESPQAEACATYRR